MATYKSRAMTQRPAPSNQFAWFYAVFRLFPYFLIIIVSYLLRATTHNYDLIFFEHMHVNVCSTATELTSFFPLKHSNYG